MKRRNLRLAFPSVVVLSCAACASAPAAPVAEPQSPTTHIPPVATPASATQTLPGAAPAADASPASSPADEFKDVFPEYHVEAVARPVGPADGVAVLLTRTLANDITGRYVGWLQAGKR